MAKRTLKRQLSLFQVIMLGTAGTLGSGIFVLTGHAAAVAGPATILAVVVAGLLSFSIALNYSEMATTYPETGGAMTYVREAWGKGLLAFLVGSMDSISSTFYCALSAVGFAFSMSLFIPGLPIVPVAIAAIMLFTVLNILGVTNIGKMQLLMGGILVLSLLTYIVAGFLLPGGFQMTTLLMPDGKFFIGDSFWTNLITIMRTIALIYALYVGFEVIADDAEEVKNPSKNIPIAMMVSLVVITVLYSLVSTVALGTLPWYELAGSDTALTDTVAMFLPGFGVIMIAFAGMVGALTSVNSSMLSATRETFTLSRDGAWPAFLQQLNRARVPIMSVLLIGVVSSLIAGIGVVEFLSYITSAGYLFVLFCSNLAMIVLRRKYPTIHRPFKVKFFPLTPIVASLTCLIVIVFSELSAILFMAGLLLLLVIYYYGWIGFQAYREAHSRSLAPGRWRLIVPYINTHEMEGLMKISTILAEAEKDLNLCVLLVATKPDQPGQETLETSFETLRKQRKMIMKKFIHYAVERNIPMYTKMIAADSLADGVIDEIKNDNNVKMLMLTAPEDPHSAEEFNSVVKKMVSAHIVNFSIFHDRGMQQLKRILVPVSGGYHISLAVKLAQDMANQEGATVDYVRIIPTGLTEEEKEDYFAQLQEVVMTTVKQIPANTSLKIIEADDVARAITDETQNNGYDLIFMGSSEESLTEGSVFGYKVDNVAENATCSVLVVYHYEPVAASWLRRQFKHTAAIISP